MQPRLHHAAIATPRHRSSSGDRRRHPHDLWRWPASQDRHQCQRHGHTEHRSQHPQEHHTASVYLHAQHIGTATANLERTINEAQVETPTSKQSRSQREPRTEPKQSRRGRSRIPGVSPTHPIYGFIDAARQRVIERAPRCCFCRASALHTALPFSSRSTTTSGG